MFCELEIDQKTFDYVSKYVKLWQQDHEIDFCCLDQQIQADEIHLHLEQACDDSCNQQAEVIDWIVANSKNFRTYLNTIKLVFTIHHCSGGAWLDFTWEEFQNIQQRMNEIKDVCLDTILIENKA